MDGGGREVLFPREGSQEEVVELPGGRGHVYREGDLGLGRTTAIRYRPSATEDRVLVEGPFMQRSPAVSPDGRWLAYTSDQSGRAEIYVTPFPGPGAPRQVSTGGGTEPAWNPLGGELFYRSTGRLVALDVETSPTFSIKGRRPLFSTELFVENPNHTAYDVMPDGQHFVFVANGAEHQDIVLVLNWFNELRAKRPD
jgi:hypothetical protein